MVGWSVEGRRQWRALETRYFFEADLSISQCPRKKRDQARHRRCSGVKRRNALQWCETKKHEVGLDINQNNNVKGRLSCRRSALSAVDARLSGRLNSRRRGHAERPRSRGMIHRNYDIKQL